MGKLNPGLVNMESEKVKLVFDNNLHYITKNDYKAAKKYFDPMIRREYDFKKNILTGKLSQKQGNSCPAFLFKKIILSLLALIINTIR